MRLADEELELAAACELIAARLPPLADELDALGAAHLEAAVRLSIDERRAATAGWRAPRARRHPRIRTRLRVAAAEWSSPDGALGWLRDRELKLARCWGAHVRAAAAWERYMRVERLLALHEEALGY
jgi:hypothetical protein